MGYALGQCIKSLLKIGLNIVDVFDAYAYTHLIGVYAGSYLFGFAQLLVRGGGGVNHQGFGIAYVGQVAGKL